MITEEVWEKAWEVIARVRDAYPRVINDAPSEEIVEALADAGLLARTEAWEDDARAEAERRWPHGEYHDPLMRGAMREKQRAFIAGAEWAAAHAKTTTAEDVTRVRAQIALLLTQHAQSVLAREGVFDFDETSERIDAILGLLAAARTHPTREQIARALREGRTNGLCTPGVRCDLCDCAQDYEDDLALRDADAVMELLRDGAK